MNNKEIGTQFERELCDELAKRGFWTHFINPDNSGAQPFDIIAVKNGRAYAIDCKTCEANRFNIKRLEDNQVFAFGRWIECGNINPLIAVKHDDKIIWIDYVALLINRSILLDAEKSGLVKKYDEILEDTILCIL